MYILPDWELGIFEVLWMFLSSVLGWGWFTCQQLGPFWSCLYDSLSECGAVFILRMMISHYWSKTPLTALTSARGLRVFPGWLVGKGAVLIVWQWRPPSPRPLSDGSLPSLLPVHSLLLCGVLEGAPTPPASPQGYRSPLQHCTCGVLLALVSPNAQLRLLHWGIWQVLPGSFPWDSAGTLRAVNRGSHRSQPISFPSLAGRSLSSSEGQCFKNHFIYFFLKF